MMLQMYVNVMHVDAKIHIATCIHDAHGKMNYW
jgi:hypothetical protein